jgi:hypothetical protein
MTRYDRWSRDGMPSGDDLRRIQSGIDATMRDVIADARRGISPSASMIPDQRAAEEQRPASGGTTEVRPPPGLTYVDALCDAADRRDRAVALKEKIETELLTPKAPQR